MLEDYLQWPVVLSYSGGELWTGSKVHSNQSPSPRWKIHARMNRIEARICGSVSSQLYSHRRVTVWYYEIGWTTAGCDWVAHLMSSNEPLAWEKMPAARGRLARLPIKSALEGWSPPLKGFQCIASFRPERVIRVKVCCRQITDYQLFSSFNAVATCYRSFVWLLPGFPSLLPR